jgi:hypothetical protein
MIKILGITNDVTCCECCGRADLKRTVILGRTDADGVVTDVLHYGSSCAARATKVRRTGKAIEALAEEAQRQAEEAHRNRTVVIDDNPADVLWVVESIGSNGGHVERLCYARGTLPAIRQWARAEYPYFMTDVRKTI